MISLETIRFARSSTYRRRTLEPIL